MARVLAADARAELVGALVGGVAAGRYTVEPRDDGVAVRFAIGDAGTLERGGVAYLLYTTGRVAYLERGQVTSVNLGRRAMRSLLDRLGKGGAA